MTSIHDKSSFIPGGGNVQNSQRNTFLGAAEGANPQLMKSSGRASKVRGQGTTAKKRTGVGIATNGKKTAPKRGSLGKITPS